MSYSFNVRATSLALAATTIAAELDKVSLAHPIHSRDREATDNAVASLLALTSEPIAGHELSISVAGSCYGPEGQAFSGISLSIHINLVAQTS